MMHLSDMRTENILSAVGQMLHSDSLKSRINKSLFSIKFREKNFTSIAHKKMDHLYGHSSVEDSINMCRRLYHRESMFQIEQVAKSIYKRKMTSSGARKLTLVEKDMASFQNKLDTTKEQMAIQMRSHQKAKDSDSICKITLDMEELVCFVNVYQRRIKMSSLERKHILMPSQEKKIMEDKIQAVDEFLRLIWKMYFQTKETVMIRTQNEEVEYPHFVRISLLSFFSNQVQEILVKNPDCKLTPTLKKIKSEIIDTVEFWRESSFLILSGHSGSGKETPENPLYFL